MHHAQLTEIARPGQAAFDQTVGTLQNGLGVSHAQALTLVDRMVTQAFTMSAVDVFYGSAVIFPAVDRPGLVRPAQVREGGRRRRGGSGGGSPLDPASRLGGHRNEQTRPGGGSVANEG